MVEQVVGLRFVVDGEQQATASLKRFSAANEAAGSSILKIASKVSGAQSEFIRLNNLFEKNVIGVSALSSAHQKLASEISRLTGVTVSQARDSLALASASEKAARAAREQAEATARAAQAEQRRIMAIKELDGSILRQGQSVKTAVNRLNELDALQAKGAVSAAKMAQGQLEIARALAAANGYITANGALNTQRAQAEIRAAQTAQRLADATRAQAAADAAAAANKARLTQSYNQLLASINPVIAAQQRTRQTVDMLRAAVAAGAITTTQAAQALLQYRAALRAMNSANQQTALGLNRTGVITQQAGYQVGDFIVQIQSGTNAMVALGQQATQLIGTFAAFATTTRSIMILSGLGVIVPILTAIGAAMMRTSGASDTLSQKMDKLKSSSDKVFETLDLLSDSDLAEKFGNMTSKVQSLSTAMLALDDAAALRNLLGTLEKIEKQADAGFFKTTALLALGGLGGGFGGAVNTDQMLQSANEKAFKKLGLQMSRETYLGYVEGIRAAARAGDREAVVSLFDTFIQDATDAGTAASKVSAQGYVVADAMQQSALATAELVARLNGSADAAKALADQEKDRLEKLNEQNELIHNGMMAREMAYYMLIGQEEEKRLADGERYHAAMIARQNAYYAIIKEGEAERIAKGEQYYAGMIALQAGHANKIKADEQARVSAIAQQYKLYADTRKEADALSESLGEAYLDAVGLGQADVSKGVSAAAQAALLLAQRLNISLGAAQGMIRLSAEQSLERESLAAQYSQYGQGRASAEALIRENRTLYGGTGNVLAGMNYYDVSGADGGGGGGGGAADEFTSRVLSGELLEAIKRAQEETALYEKEVQMLDSALSSGLITQMEYNSYVQQAKEAYGQASQGAYDYEKAMEQVSNTAMSSMEDAFMSILDGSKSASDAFKDMARAIIAEAMRMLVIRPLLQGLFGGAGGGGGFLGGLLNANGNAFIGGNVTAFANGGVVGGPTMFPMSGGRTGLMGEAGPEAIMPLKRTSSGKLGVVAEGGGAVSVQNVINVQGDNAAAVRQEIAKLMPTITEATKSAVIDARRRGGQMRAAFS